MSIGERIRSERERLGYTQEAFAALGESAKRSQIGWEQDRSQPNAGVLAGWAKAGADVLYIVTGRRTVEIDATLFGMCESALREAYRKLRPGAPELFAFRSTQLVRLYNAVAAKLGPDTPINPTIDVEVERFIEWFSDPTDPAQLDRVLLHQAERTRHGDSPEDRPVVAGSRNVTANGPGAVAVGKGVHYHGEQGKPRKR